MTTPKLETDRLILREIHSDDAEAISTVIKYAVEVKKINEISTSYDIENVASGRVLQKLGFQFVKEIPYECNGGEKNLSL